MRLSLIVPLGIAAFLGMAAMDTPDANAFARRTVVSTPRGTTVITRRPRRMAFRTIRSRRLAAGPGWRRARGAVVCRTVITRSGMRVRRCF